MIPLLRRLLMEREMTAQRIWDIVRYMASHVHVDRDLNIVMAIVVDKATVGELANCPSFVATLKQNQLLGAVVDPTICTDVCN
jgi:hypothetical protein